VIIDYLVKNKMGEEVSMTHYLQKVEGGTIRKALDDLIKHGLLSKRVRQQSQFSENIAPHFNIRIKEDQIEYNPTQSKVLIYSFNTDILFILKAKVFELRDKLNSRIEKVRQLGTVYTCSNSHCHNSQ
jgi:hypothetical protein